jgi:hypothetical protein
MFITLIRRTLVLAATTFVANATFVSTGHAASSPCAMLPAVGGLTTATSPSTSYPIEARSTDPVGPFPLAARAVLLPFPWATIEGIWTMKLPDGTTSHVSFDVQADCSGRKFIQILGFDQKTYRVTAEGVGIGASNDTIVRAAMTGTGAQYMVFVRQFKETPAKGQVRLSTVVTIRPFDGDSTNDVHMIARKASALTLPEYIQQQRDLEEKRQADRRRSISTRP